MGDARNSSFVSQSSILVVANGLSALLAAAYVSTSARLLGPDDYGIVTAALSFSYLLTLVIGPLETGISRFASVYQAHEDRARLALLTAVAMRRVFIPLFVSCIAGVLLTRRIGRAVHLPTEVCLLVVAFTAASLLASIPRGTLRGMHRFLQYGINQVVESCVRLAIGLCSIVLGAHALGALFGYAAGVAAASVFGLAQLRDLRTDERDVRIDNLYTFSGPLFVVYAYQVATVNLDMMFAKRHLTDSTAGLYGAAAALARILYLVATPLYQVLFSRVTALHARGEDTRRLSMMVLSTVGVGLALSNLVPWLMGHLIVRVLFGPEFDDAIPLVRILWMTTSILVIQTAIIFVLIGVDRARGLWLFAIPIVVMVVLLRRWSADAVGIAHAGLVAVCLGLLIAFFLLAVADRRLRRHRAAG